MQAIVDRNLSRRHVGNHHGNEERTHALRAFIKEALICAVHRLDAPNPRTNVCADPVVIHLFQINPCILKCHPCRYNSKLRITVHALCFLLIDIAIDIKVLDLASNLRSIVRRVKSGDAFNAVLACEQGIPEGLLANADRRDRANPCNDNSLLQTNRLLS